MTCDIYPALIEMAAGIVLEKWLYEWQHGADYSLP
jgi:hypothetical protein